jgi:anti-sigma factor RsiW
MTPLLRCADVEILLADYIDQTLLDRDVMEVKAHLASCPACAEMAADAAAAVALMERAAEVEPPPELVNKILFEVTSGGSQHVVKAPLATRLFGKWLQPVLQPRFAMGMAMTMLSLGMLLRTAGVRELSDLSPTHIYAAGEDKVARWWDRGVKHYQSLKLVYEIQARYQQWAAEQDSNREKNEKQKQDGARKQ